MWAYLALAGVQAYSGFGQADAIRRNADTQQKINEMNAKFAEYDANEQIKAGQSQAAAYQSHVDSVIGQQREILAGQNVDVNYGTAKDIQADSRLAGVVTSLQIQRQAREKAFGYQMQAINTRMTGEFQKDQAQINASADIEKGFLNAGATTLSGYERLNSTGTGNTSRTGTSDKPTWRTSGNDSFTSETGGGGYV